MCLGYFRVISISFVYILIIYIFGSIMSKRLKKQDSQKFKQKNLGKNKTDFIGPYYYYFSQSKHNEQCVSQLREPGILVLWKPWQASEKKYI